MTAKHWYFITEFYCPQCGNSDIYRERRYDPKPEKYEDRRRIVDAYDYCDA